MLCEARKRGSFRIQAAAMIGVHTCRYAHICTMVKPRRCGPLALYAEVQRGKKERDVRIQRLVWTGAINGRHRHVRGFSRHCLWGDD